MSRTERERKKKMVYVFVDGISQLSIVVKDEPSSLPALEEEEEK